MPKTFTATCPHCGDPCEFETRREARRFARAGCEECLPDGVPESAFGELYPEVARGLGHSDPRFRNPDWLEGVLV
jgi:reverse gyrase